VEVAVLEMSALTSPTPSNRFEYTQEMRTRVLFLDWHQTLCHQPFWQQELTDREHPLHDLAQVAVHCCFEAQSPSQIDAWMRGECDTTSLLQAAVGDSGATELSVALRQSIIAMTPTPVLWQAIGDVHVSVLPVIASDNVEAFSHHAPDNPFLAQYPLLCSADLGCTKASDPAGFFGGWLQEHGLTFQDACLLDDRADNCAVFREQGGYAIQYQSEFQSMEDLQAWAATFQG
jgi:hypothetical protein